MLLIFEIEIRQSGMWSLMIEEIIVQSVTAYRGLYED